MDNKLTDSEKIAKWQKEKLGEKNYNEIQEKVKHDSEIVKALECCADEVFRCEECPYQSFKYSECYELITRDALDLINRLQAENEESKNNCDKCAGKTRNCIESLQNIIAELKAEAEIADSGTSCHWCEDTIRGVAKAEAYKECIEKVKEKSQVEIYCDNQLHEPITTYHITEDTLFNLLKELVGE